MAEKTASISTDKLAASIAEQIGTTKAEAKRSLEQVFSVIAAHMREGSKVKIGGFGIFQVKDRKARTGRNPATGEEIQIKASKKVAFRASKELKESI